MYVTSNENEGIHIQKHLYVLSADLGQAFDYTAISVIERVITDPGVLGPDRRGERMYYLRHIERVRGVEYPAIVERIRTLYKSPQLAGTERAVCIDFTDLGRPVFDLMRRMGFEFSLTGINIIGGVDVTYENGHYTKFRRDSPKWGRINPVTGCLEQSSKLGHKDIFYLGESASNTDEDGEEDESKDLPGRICAICGHFQRSNTHGEASCEHDARFKVSVVRLMTKAPDHRVKKSVCCETVNNNGILRSFFYRPGGRDERDRHIAVQRAARQDNHRDPHGCGRRIWFRLWRC